MKMEWQPAVIAPLDHIMQHHPKGPQSVVAMHAGTRIRVRPSEDSLEYMRSARAEANGCYATISVEVHPEDAHKLWPHIYTGDSSDALCTLCEHQILTD